VVEEVDETEYWLEVIKDVELSNDTVALTELLKEANELNRIMSKARKNT